MSNAINWFEIPAADFDRAVRFYETVLGVKLHRETMGADRMAILPHASNGVGGAITYSPNLVPGRNGVVVYLAAGDDLSAALGRVEAAGGRILLPRTQVSPEIGYIAHFLDTEGNRVALHSPH